MRTGTCSVSVLLERLRQKHRTVGYPKQPPVLPDRYRGLPELNPRPCAKDRSACAAACPTGAVTIDDQRQALDLGR